MTYYITFLTNDKAQLIVSETRTTDVEISVMVKARGEAQGYKVVVKVEG